jgi:hypothetical protein
MNDRQILKRKIQLKRQALDIINDEMRELQFRLSLAYMVEHLEQQQCNDFDPLVSRKLECLDFIKNN